MRWLLIGTLLALMIMLAVGQTGAADDSTMKRATSHTETGAKNIGELPIR
jgi:hypothetical protein